VLERQTRAEHLIRLAMVEVEKIGAHPDLTSVVLTLQTAQQEMGDFVDDMIQDRAGVMLAPLFVQEIERVGRRP
jgi:hypothetical protein